MSISTYTPPPASSAEKTSTIDGRARRSGAASIRVAALCFVLALVVCLLQNSSRSSIDQAWSFDSSHYLHSAQQLFLLWQNLLRQGPEAFNSNLLAPLAEDLLLDGPVLPLLGSMVLVCTNKALTFAHVLVFIALQSCFSACTAAMLCLTATRFTGSYRWGALAGILWAVYPPAVIAAGKFMTELPSALLLVSLVFVLSMVVEPGRRSLIRRVGLPLSAGILTAAIWLLKAALAPPSVLINLVAFAQVRTVKGRVLLSSALATGLVATLLPWLVFTKVSTGHIQVLPQRVPVLNAIYGLELETDGWGSVAPKSPLQRTYSEQDGLLPVCIAMISAHPSESVSLILRKTTRLWDAPYNDYHRKFLRVFTPVAQAWWHDALILGGLFGLLIFLTSATGRRPSSPAALLIGTAGAITIAAHLIFGFFSTCSRYGFTAMPFFILFAAYALARIFEKRTLRQAVLALACAGALVVSLRAGLVPLLAVGTTSSTTILGLELFFHVLLLTLAIVFTAGTIRGLQKDNGLGPAAQAVLGIAWFCLLLPILANATSDRTIREWASTLESGQTACRRIILPDKSKDSRWAYVIFDGDDRSREAQIRVNGASIEDKPKLIYTLNSRATADDFQVVFAKLLRVSEERMRQWRVVAVPPSLLRSGEPNTISLQPRDGRSITIYGDYPGWSQAPTVPSLTYFSPTKLCNVAEPLDARAATLLDRPPATDVCWLRDHAGDGRDLSSAAGTQFGRYRLYLLTGFARHQDGKPDISAPGHRIW